jgi:hypothetical protein
MRLRQQSIAIVAVLICLSLGSPASALTPAELRAALNIDRAPGITVSPLACAPASDRPSEEFCKVDVQAEQGAANILIVADASNHNVSSAALMMPGSVMLDEKTAAETVALCLILSRSMVDAFSPELLPASRAALVVGLIKGIKRQKNQKRVGGHMYAMNSGQFFTLTIDADK